MLDYEAYCKIRDCHDRQHLTITQTARALGLHPQTVTKWLKAGQYRPRQSPPRASRLDPFKAQVVRWLDAHPYSAQQIFQRLREVVRVRRGELRGRRWGNRCPHIPAIRSVRRMLGSS